MSFKIVLAAIYKDFKGEGMEEIGIASITSVLREKGYEVLLLGAIEEKLDYSRIFQFKPDIVGVPVYNHTKDTFYTFCRKIKQELPETYICAGGYFTTYNDVDMLKEEPCVDFAVRGEGEYVFLELVQRLEKGESLENIKGLTYRQEGEVKVNEGQDMVEDLDTLPFPSRDILFENKLKITIMSTSRGCQRSCNFCVNRTFWKKWRGRSVSNVLTEMKALYDMGYTSFNFIDSSFEDPDPNHSRLLAIARGIIDLGMKISYFIDLRAEFHRFASHDLMVTLKESGLRGGLIGIETANEFDRKLYGKWADIDDNCKIIELLRKYDINADIAFINFNPYSNFDRLRANIDYLEKYGYASKFETVITRFRVFRGCSLYEKMKADGLMRPGRYDDEYAYEYIDKRVEKLALFISRYMDYVTNGPEDLIGKIFFYANYYLLLLLHYRGLFDNDQHREGHRLTSDHEKYVKEVLFDLNKRNARWFRELVDLAENDWNEEKAEKIMQQLLGIDTLRGYVEKLDTAQYKLYEDLLFLDPEYESYLQWK